MIKYAKIVCGALVVPQIYPGYIVLDGKKIYNPTDEQYRNAGYLPLEETPQPEDVEGKIAVATYAVNEEETAIVQSWHYEDVPDVEPHTDGEEGGE
jgi:hypothetical protein